MNGKETSDGIRVFDLHTSILDSTKQTETSMKYMLT